MSDAPVIFYSQVHDPSCWSVLEMLEFRDQVRRQNERAWDRRDVYAAHDRFRRCYLRNGVSLNLCRCMAHVEPHLHAPHKLKRIGHLPMFTMKELPE